MTRAVKDKADSSGRSGTSALGVTPAFKSHFTDLLIQDATSAERADSGCVWAALEI